MEQIKFWRNLKEEKNFLVTLVCWETFRQFVYIWKKSNPLKECVYKS